MVLEKDVYMQHHILADAWNLQVGREVCTDVEAGLEREWLVTNGLGGYAAGSILGATTRCYHGLLVIALHPPVARTVLVAKIDEEVTLPDGTVMQLGVNEYRGGTIHPQGYVYLERCWLDGDIVCFLYRLSDTLSLEKRIWMEYGRNTTYVQYILHGSFEDLPVGAGASPRVGPAPPAPTALARSVTLKLFPFCLSRDHHSATQGAADWHFLVDNQKSRCRVRAYDGAPIYYIVADPDAFFTSASESQWCWHILHRRDSERGLSDHEDVYVPGFFQLSLEPEIRKTLVLSAEADLSVGTGREIAGTGREIVGAGLAPAQQVPTFGSSSHEEAVALALVRHHRRMQQILAATNHHADDLPLRDPVHARLVLAADQFIVVRPDWVGARHNPYEQGVGAGHGLYEQVAPKRPSQPLRLAPDCKTIIAGYPWFTDWGRDSMISLPGLLLHTGRYSEARGLLKAFASLVHNGLIPNRFSDGGELPVYNAVDAALWMFYATDRYLRATNDWTLLKELFLALSEIIQWHIRGTDYGIRADPQDGLLSAGASGVQLTWMDAQVDGWVVTPRCGKPVEINALWYNALTVMEAWAVHLSIDATQYSQWRSRVRQHFASRFWYQEGGYLYDVVDVDGMPGCNDAALRPNQLFAASLTHDLLSEEQVASMFRKVTDALLTPVGLRTLSPSDPNYHNHFHGNPKECDSAYHQGTVWPWLIGAYIDVHLRVHNNRAALKPLLLPFVQQLWEVCLGTIGEVVEPEAPFAPGGCFAQAWSVAEVLRCWLLATN